MQQLCLTTGFETYELITSQPEIHNSCSPLKSMNDISKYEVESVVNSSITCKQRIDMMFRDTRSVMSEYQPVKNYNETRKSKSLIEGVNYAGQYEIRRKMKNDIQLKIEQMFSEVSSSEQETELSLINENKFPVKYIGSVPIVNKISDIEDLQEPLSDLYFKYRQNKPDDNLKDKIEVTTNGLQIEYDNGKGHKPTSKMYPFSCIAVSISVKVFCRKRFGNQTWEYAFLPLAADTENISNNGLLFQKLSGNGLAYFQKRNYEDNSSLFVVVLREIDFQTKQLVCQGFICESSDEAIALADIIHKVLKLRHNRILRTRNQRRRFRYKNGMSRLSSIGETVTDSIGETITESLENEKKDNFENIDAQNDISDDDSIENKVKKVSSIPRPPKRPPRKPKEKSYPYVSNSTSAMNNIDVNEIQVISDDSDPKSSHLIDNKIRLRGNERKKIHRTSSNRSNKISDVGDVLTKVAIPRSCSFLNTDKLNSKYRRRDDCLQNECDSIEDESHNVENSPLGFMEMFNELRIQEGVNTLDEILNVIININGMSFNNLKPIYKEFLLKLALVLTKDELFDRSKFIMGKQKQKVRKHQRLKKIIATKHRLRHIFEQTPKVKLKTSNRIFKNIGKNKNRRKLKKMVATAADSTSTDSFFMTKSFQCLNSKVKQTDHCKFLKNQSTSDDSDYANRMRRRSIARDKDSSVEGLRASSSGYFSFSECSYDTESCTCATIDRCYCSLRKSARNLKNSANSLDNNANSCYKYDKCYCDKMKKLSLVEQLKLKGFADSESSISEDNTPVYFRPRDKKSSSYRSKGGSKLSKSLEYVENDQFRYRKRMDVYGNSEKQNGTSQEYESSSTENSKTSAKASAGSDNLAVDYKLFARSENNYRKSKNFYFAEVRPKIVYAELSHPSSSKISTIFHKNKYVPSIKNTKIKPSSNAQDIKPCCNCTCMLRNSSMLPNYSQYQEDSSYYRRTNMENDLGYYP